MAGKTGSLSFTQSGGPAQSGPLLAAIRQQDPNATIINYTLAYSVSYRGTDTYYASVQNVTLSVWLANITQLNSGKLYVNTAWRGFSLRGSWNVLSHGQSIDVNGLFLGPMGANLGIFGAQLRARRALEFQVFNLSLSAWSRSYNPISGITTFKKTEPVYKPVLLSVNINGRQNYTLYIKEDPSATLQVQGYAVPAGSYLVLESPPATVYLPYALGAAALILAVGAVVELAKKRRNPTRIKSEQATPP